MVAEGLKALARYPDDERLLYYVGDAALRLGRLNLAQEMGGALLKAYPENADGHEILARYYEARKDRVSALGHYDAAIASDPESAHLHLLKALYLYYQCDLPNDSLRHAEAGLELEPDNSDLIGLLADIYYQLKRPGEGEEMIQRALALDPEAAGHHYSLAMDQLSRGRWKNGISSLRRVLRLSPGYMKPFQLAQAIAVNRRFLAYAIPKEILLPLFATSLILPTLWGCLSLFIPALGLVAVINGALSTLLLLYCGMAWAYVGYWYWRIQKGRL